MKRLLLASMSVMLFSMTGLSFAAESPDRPAGVTEKNWVPVNARLGIVLVESGGPVVQGLKDKPLLLKPPANGYFMIKGANGWTRLVVVEPIKGPADVG
jgi:hypothetical protein